MALYNELLTSLLNSQADYVEIVCALLILSWTGNPTAMLVQRGLAQTQCFFNYLQSIGMQKRMTVIGERLQFD